MGTVSGLTSCSLCPRRCGADRAHGWRGACGADGSLCVARAALHEWEEPSISVGRGSGTVFFSNCPLRCAYCQNASIAHDGFGVEVDVSRLARIFLELQEQDAGNINLVTGTQYLPWILDALEQARGQGLRIPIVWNTSGYETVECVLALAGAVDVYLADFKYWRSDESDAAMRYSHAEDYFEVALAALDEMVDQVGSVQVDGNGAMKRGVVVRHLLLPGRLQDSKRIMAFLWRRYGLGVRYSVMSQYTPMREFPSMPELNERTTHSDYESLLDFLDELGLEDYYWQEGDPALDSFVPAFDATGVVEGSIC